MHLEHVTGAKCSEQERQCATMCINKHQGVHPAPGVVGAEVNETRGPAASWAGRGKQRGNVLILRRGESWM